MTPRSLALALCAGGLALPALAQTVTVYGRVDMSVSRHARLISNGQVTDATMTTLDSGGYSGSRMGLKGQEDLGGGLKALFVLEQGLQADTGMLGQGGRAFGRQAYVGMEGDWGRLTAGRQYTPWFDALSSTDPFGNNLVGNSGNLALANARADNALLYRSPVAAGFSGQALYAVSEGAATGRQTSLSMQYQGGPVTVNAGMGRATATVDGRSLLLGGSVNLGAVRLYAHGSWLRNLNPTVQAAPSLAAGARGRTWLLGAAAPLGQGMLMASWVHLDDQRAQDRDASQWAAGYLHRWSLRTSLYAGHARVINRNGGTLTPNTPSYPGRGEAQTQLGISHAF